jgi:4-hydroxy-2-oxoheptanedioate aldolase
LSLENKEFSMNLKQKIQAGQTLFTAWSSIPDPLTAGALASTDFDAVTLDMQHGGHSDDSVLRSIGPVIQSGAHAVVRVPVGRFDMASRALDFGAEAVIAPMINTLVDAKAFADAMKYPPLGERSWGPGRGMAFHGYSDFNTYLKEANGMCLAIAMVETLEALENLDAFLALDGIDGIFVGPGDFSIAWSKGARYDPKDDGMTEIFRDVASRCRKAGKFAGNFGSDAAHAKFLASLGYQFVAIGTDVGCIKGGANGLVAAAKG